LSILESFFRLAHERRNKMPQYMLLLRAEPSAFADFSPEELQKIMQRYGDWRRSPQNRIAMGQKLTDTGGRVMRTENGRPLVTDGPFAESKEVMGGFFVVAAEDYDQAVELAKTCPHMDFGSIEVRQVEPT
jgi:hypothetical protein